MERDCPLSEIKYTVDMDDDRLRGDKIAELINRIEGGLEDCRGTKVSVRIIQRSKTMFCVYQCML